MSNIDQILSEIYNKVEEYGLQNIQLDGVTQGYKIIKALLDRLVRNGSIEDYHIMMEYDDCLKPINFISFNYFDVNGMLYSKVQIYTDRVDWLAFIRQIKIDNIVE